MKINYFTSLFALFAASIFAKDYVDYVNCKMGGVSHVLVPARETVQLPNSMMRAFAFKFDSAAVALHSLPLFVHTHRFLPNTKLNVFTNGETPQDLYLFDRERITPYSYSVFLEDDKISVDYAVSKRSAIYSFDFSQSSPSQKRKFCIYAKDFLDSFTDENAFGVSYRLRGNTKVYIYVAFDAKPESYNKTKNSQTAIFAENVSKLGAKYGVSFISYEKAKDNLAREIKDFNLNAVAEKGRQIWNAALSQIEVFGKNENEKTVFYTSFWRTKERMVNYDEYGQFYNAYSDKVCQSFDNSYIYCDDWSWDTYRTSHPLYLILNPDYEKKCLKSILFFGESSPKKWLPKFPTIDGDNQYMNGNHIVASFIDAYNKGIRDLDLKTAYRLAMNTVQTKSLLPDTICDSGELSKFYYEKGYIPALREGQKESFKEVNLRMKRQPVSVTTATAYDDWCLSQIAEIIGEKESAEKLLKQSYNYRNLLHPKTKFMHPKDDRGEFIKNVDYSLGGGLGFRDYYTENNAYICRWDVEQNMPDLISQIGGYKAFESALDEMFSKIIHLDKSYFYRLCGGNHSATVGNFSMGNEPCMRIPYLYNSALTPWKTQKMLRHLIDMWFRNDYMGIPGDEDGGAMSAFVVFSQLGFFPTNIGYPIYDFGSPYFDKAIIHLPDNKTLTITAKNASAENKYVKSMKIDGKPYNKTWIYHKDLMSARQIDFEMSSEPNYKRGVSPDDLPEYFKSQNIKR